MSNVLIVAAHPDDEVLGCACAIQKHKEEGDHVSVLFMSNDGVGRYPANQSLIQRDIQKAQEILGIDKVYQENFIDQGMDIVQLTALISPIEKLVRDNKINVVYTHNSNDLNKDHRLSSEATIIACRPVPGSTVTKLLMYWVPSFSELRTANNFNPNIGINAVESLSNKIRAMEAYESELREFPHPRSSLGLECHAKSFGMMFGFKAAEAFQLVYDRS